MSPAVDPAPLHVQVAAVFGWSHFSTILDHSVGMPSEDEAFSPAGPRRVWVGVMPGITLKAHKPECVYGYDDLPCPHKFPQDFLQRVPLVGVTWEATGPFLELYRLHLEPTVKTFNGPDGKPLPGSNYIAAWGRPPAPFGIGQTACEAVAYCLLEMARRTKDGMVPALLR